MGCETVSGVQHVLCGMIVCLGVAGCVWHREWSAQTWYKDCLGQTKAVVRCGMNDSVREVVASGCEIWFEGNGVMGWGQKCVHSIGDEFVWTCSEVDGVDVMSCGVCAAMSF